MPRNRIPVRLVVLAIVSLAMSTMASAEPYLAVQEGHHCGTCHVSPAGGGMRNVFGNVYSRMLLPGYTLGNEDSESFKWNGEILDILKAGANVRGGYRHSSAPGRGDVSDWDVERASLYVAVEPVKDKLLIYADQEFGQGDHFNREAWVRWKFNPSFYVRAGRIFLPFGLRIEDDTAFARQISGINFTTPDKGVEFGFDKGPWSAQLAVSNGTAGGPELDSGKQVSLSAVYVKPRWRIGSSLNFNNSAAGDRELYSLFAGTVTGPVAWLAEFDFVVDFGFPEGRRSLVTTLLEANWKIRKGLNAKLTYEHLDPDDTLREDQQNRISAVVELFPIQFTQVRLGVRYYDGIPQSSVQNRTEAFLQLHAFF